jgi:hypothetical protein
MFPEFTRPRGFKKEIFAPESTEKARMASASEPAFETLTSVFAIPLVLGEATSVLMVFDRTRSAHDLGAAGFGDVWVESTTSVVVGGDSPGDGIKV